MKIDFAIIKHSRQRYETVGDWFKKAGVWYFRISRMKDKRYVWLVFIHEFIEWALCQLNGVKQKDIDKFDRDYEDSRPLGAPGSRHSEVRTPCGCLHREEPGDDPHAPYHEAHAIASECERLIAKALGVNWVTYDEAVNDL